MTNKNQIKIVQMNLENVKECDNTDQQFQVIGRLLPKYEDSCWTYQEEIYETSYESNYNGEDLDEYIINSEDSVAFLGYLGKDCIGHITLRREDSTKFASIDRLIVSKNHRGRSIGTALLNRAKEWAIENDMKGLTLETQDVNLLACRFYFKNKFQIGAVDNMLYSHSSYSDEKAIFLYLTF